MNRAIARSAIALFLLLTALLLPLTCAAAAETYTYNEYSWDESKGELKTNTVSKELSEMTPIDTRFSSWYLGGTSSEPYFYYAALPSGVGWSAVPLSTLRVQGDVSILLLCGVQSESDHINVVLEQGSTLTIYGVSTTGSSIAFDYADFSMGAGSTLNLHCMVRDATVTSNSADSRPTINCYKSFNFSTDNSPLNIKDTILNIYGESLIRWLSLDNSTLSLYAGTTFGRTEYTQEQVAVSLTNSKMNIYDGKITLRGENQLSLDENSSLNLCPRGENEYYGIFSGTSSSQDSLIGAYKGAASNELIEKINSFNRATMVRMTAIGIDETPQTCYVDESPSFTLKVLTEGVSSASFTVEYKQNGAYSTTPPTQPGAYDVRITRPLDNTYLPFETEISGGLVITKHSQSAPTGVAAVAETIRYKNDGRLTGVTAAMEYRAGDSGDYTAVTGTKVANLAPGIYFVRFKETATHFASADVQVEVASGRAAYDTGSTQGVKGISADNVQPENEALLRQALSDYQNALDTLGTLFTEAEKQEVLAAMERIRSALASLERAAAVREAITALPGAVEPDDTDAEASIRAAKTAYDALTAHEKELVGDAPAAKLDSLLSMLTAYRITYGDGASIIAGQNTALSFTANGPLSKLTAVLVDGKTLDAKHYTAQSGSTIITLAADYVRTLAVGEHTLTVRYTDGETSARFTVTAMPKDIPQTGDTSRLTLWLALLGACCAGLWCVSRRRG